MENEQADAGRDGRTRPVRPNSQARTDNFSPCSADYEQDMQPYPVGPYDGAVRAPQVLLVTTVKYSTTVQYSIR